MKNKVVLAVALLLLLGTVITVISFAINAAIEYDGLKTQENKENALQNAQGNSSETPKDPVEAPTVSDATKDNFFWNAAKGPYYGYAETKMDSGNDYWQFVSDEVGSNQTLLRYAGDGTWLVTCATPGWVTTPIVVNHYEYSENVDSIEFSFYYQVFRNGAWEEELHKIDGGQDSVFSVYVQTLPSGVEATSWNIDYAEKVTGVYSVPVKESCDVYISIGLEKEIDINDYMFVNFVLVPKYEAYY